MLMFKFKNLAVKYYFLNLNTPKFPNIGQSKIPMEGRWNYWKNPNTGDLLPPADAYPNSNNNW